MSAITQIIHDLLSLFGYLLAFIYSFVHNYVIAIAILTVVVLVPFTPLVVKNVRNSRKNAEAMKRIQPEMKRIKEEYKNDLRRRNEELQALYSREQLNPVSGCLPMLPQFAVLWVFYVFIRGVYHTTGGKHPKIDPLYISKTSLLYKNLIVAGGHLKAFGMDLSQKVPMPNFSSGSWIPYWILVAVGVGFSYIQLSRMYSRMPANPQMSQASQQAMARIMPLLFAFTYFIFPVAVGVYYAVSAIVRLGQYEYVFWRYEHIGHEHERKRQIFGGNKLATGNKAPESKDINTNGLGPKKTRQRPNSKRNRKG
jgi:YidC/Oxa1 family membrane protein insertase